MKPMEVVGSSKMAENHVIVALGLLVCGWSWVEGTHGEYLIGVGSYDMTGPAADVNMMGYANLEQNTAGIHFRLRARTFIVGESPDGPRFVFVNLDACMASQLLTIKLLQRLNSRFGNLYSEENVAISGTHTHGGPGGYMQYLVYSVTSLGFVKQSFDVIADAIEQSIIQAHNNLKPASIYLNIGEVKDAGINRSPSAYLQNPANERARYPFNVDTEMTLLRFVDGESGESVGAFTWFATHGTSMSNKNKLITGDNKGVAARLFEDWFASQNTSSTTNSLVQAYSRGTSSASAHIQVDDHCKRKHTQANTNTQARNDCRAMAGYALVVASTTLQSHCQWVSPYHTHEVSPLSLTLGHTGSTQD
ncbi:hypothetical protein LR48_Vigan304s001100 [Vigna angularis]|uniref:Neutral ceramidase n=1 Tax=Phaseolus angularis TaxID=3914 RepID=A0A0L9T986_PHAAN|nr:hypothetical protein LR48_Vigan304s001100 [Vigna angularis]